MKLNQEQLFSALGKLIELIEGCGASPELTDAVTLASDIRQAVGNKSNPPNQFSAVRVLAASTPEEYLNRISALRMDINDFEASPGFVLAPFEPVKKINRAWIPQTMGDQIWVVYEFENVKDRLEWEGLLPPILARCLDRDLIENALSYGWLSRDMNGVPQ